MEWHIHTHTQTVSDYKKIVKYLNVQMSVIIICTEYKQGNSVKNAISFTLAPPNIKKNIYISINLIKYIQNLNEETIKVWLIKK